MNARARRARRVRRAYLRQIRRCEARLTAAVALADFLLAREPGFIDRNALETARETILEELGAVVSGPYGLVDGGEEEPASEAVTAIRNVLANMLEIDIVGFRAKLTDPDTEHFATEVLIHGRREAKRRAIVRTHNQALRQLSNRTEVRRGE